MTNEHQGQCIYETGRFRLREETDYAIVDELKDFPPIMVITDNTDDGSEPSYADRRSVLHLINELADTNPNEQRHFYLKYRLDKLHMDNDILRRENEQLKKQIQKWKEKYFDIGEMFSKQVDTIDEVNNIIENADKMTKEELINKLNKEVNDD